MDIILVIIRWFEGMAAQGWITVRALPDIVAIPVMGVVGVTSLVVFFWVDNYLLHRRGK